MKDRPWGPAPPLCFQPQPTLPQPQPQPALLHLPGYSSLARATHGHLALQAFTAFTTSASAVTTASPGLNTIGSLASKPSGVSRGAQLATCRVLAQRAGGWMWWRASWAGACVSQSHAHTGGELSPAGCNTHRRRRRGLR